MKLNVSLQMLLLAGVLFFWSGVCQAERIITVGRPTNEVRLEYNRLQPIAAYLGQEMGKYGVSGGEVVLDAKNSVAACLELIDQGKIDLIFETPYSALQFINKGGAVPIMLIEREGVSEYHSLIFAREDSGIRSVSDLAGKVIAFEDPGSTSAYLLPSVALTEAGLELMPVADPETPVPEGKVGYVFAGSELNVSSWVFYQRVQAGALSSLDYVAQNENPESFRKEFTILLKTRQVPRMLVLARPGLEPELQRGAIEVLSAIAQDPAAREAFASYKIDAFHPIADPQEFIRQLQQTLEQ